MNFDFFYFRDKESGDYVPSDLMGSFRVRRYKKGEYIAMKGDRVRELSIVVEGIIRVDFVIDSGLVVRSVLHDAPMLVGAMAIVVGDERYLTDTVAHDDVVVLSYSRDRVMEAMMSNFEFTRSLMAFVAGRLESMSAHIAVLAHKNIKSKLAYYIFICSQGGAYVFDRRIGPLADYLCVERPSLSRVLGQLVEEGLITYRRGKGEILDERGLKRYIE